MGSPAGDEGVLTPTTTGLAGAGVEAPRCPTGKATPYFPVVRPVKRDVHVEDADEPRTVRARHRARLLTRTRLCRRPSPPSSARWTPYPTTPPSARSSPSQRRQRTLRRSSGCCCARARCSHCYWCSKTCTGSMPRRKPCSTASSTACQRPECCYWSTTAPNTSTAGGARPTIRNCRLDPLPPASAEAVLNALLGLDPSLAPLKRLLIERTEGNPFFLEESVRTLVETGVLVGEPGRLSPDAGPADHPGAGHGAGGVGCTHRPATLERRKATPPGCRGHWHRGAPDPARGHCRAARGGAASRPGAPPGRRVSL